MIEICLTKSPPSLVCLWDEGLNNIILNVCCCEQIKFHVHSGDNSRGSNICNAETVVQTLDENGAKTTG